MTQESILVVEDESVVAMDLENKLRRLGYHVPAVLISGEEAVQAAADMCPDLVLMDVRLNGGMDGIETAGEIRARFDIPVVYLTAFADDATLERARLTAPFGYLLKPFQEQELHATIKIALHKHKLDVALQEAERRSSLYAERLGTLREIDRAILTEQSPEAVAQAALRRIRQLVPCQRASVALADHERQEITLLAVHVNGDNNSKQEAGLSQMTLPGFSTLARGQHYLVEDMQALEDRSAFDERLFTEGVRSYVSLPLYAQNELIGSLNLEAQETGAFTEERIEIIREVADSLAVAVHQACLHEQVSYYCRELEARNDDLEAFAHTVAHDLNTPLGVVAGFARLLKKSDGSLSDQDRMQYLDLVERNAYKMSSIVRELMLLAQVRREDVVARPLDMAAIVATVLQQLAPMLEEYQAEVVVPQEWPVAQGYAAWVEEIWVNYISNALKYGGEPPRVELGATMQADGQVRFWAKDNGRGISQEDQERLFVPFTQLDQANTKGHGLGLSIVGRIVEKLQGRVGVESEMGLGSIFSFTLPEAVVPRAQTDPDSDVQSVRSER